MSFLAAGALCFVDFAHQENDYPSKWVSGFIRPLRYGDPGGLG